MELASRKLKMTDIWGFVPGSGPGNGADWRENVWQEYMPAADQLSSLDAALGVCGWLGMDVGEQDGRYIGGFAPELLPLSAPRSDQYLNFHRHFAAMGERLGNRLNALISLTYPHYLLKQGTYTMVGAETAQALPSGHIFYCFARGAAKQRGTLWLGNASVYSRWGYKTYDATTTTTGRGTATATALASVQYKCSNQNEGGPTCGTSLNLLKRLMYFQISYNSAYVSVENGWFYGANATLTPIGELQNNAMQFVQKLAPTGGIGKHVASIAIVLPFGSGWNVPRQLYTGTLWRVWGSLPFGAGDFFADGVLNMMYPGYRDASYFHDESGFMSATPFGDTVDILLSDAQSWTLQRYDQLIVVAPSDEELQQGAMAFGQEFRDQLANYVFQGGSAIMTSASLRSWSRFGGLLGVTTSALSDSDCQSFTAGETVKFVDGTAMTEPLAFQLCPVQYTSQYSVTVLATVGQTPAVLQLSAGLGTLIVHTSPHGVSALQDPAAPVISQDDVAMLSPFPLLSSASYIINKTLSAASLFSVGEGLAWSACVRRSTEFLLTVANPSLAQLVMNIRFLAGQVISLEEVPTLSQEHAPGYLPDGFEQSDIGRSTNTTIAGGDLRVFIVHVNPTHLNYLSQNLPALAPTNRALIIGRTKSDLASDGGLNRAMLTRPSFSYHWDTAVFDWRLIHRAEYASLSADASALKLSGVARLTVDLSSGIDLWPTIRLINNSDPQLYAQSMQIVSDVINKMGSLATETGLHCDVIASLHRVPENDITESQTMQLFVQTLRTLIQYATSAKVSLHLRQTAKNPQFSSLTDLDAWLRQNDLASSIKVVANTARLIAESGGTAVAMLKTLVQSNRVSYLAITAPRYDLAGALWDENGRVADASSAVKAQVAALVTAAHQTQQDAVVMLNDGVYDNASQEYADAAWLQSVIM
eukprot:TRINITY_DN12025_c0_g2_i1.p1 TRINITY_DN12025_c0_g2~~TRINITY_DN12025_c0_g2_i1.p1  ORF type:complete len:1044 (+),score=219.23 TRINITY_DN12025_c0_g2_i1:346-3132(+)